MYCKCNEHTESLQNDAVLNRQHKDKKGNNFRAKPVRRRVLPKHYAAYYRSWAGGRAERIVKYQTVSVYVCAYGESQNAYWRSMRKRLPR